MNDENQEKNKTLNWAIDSFLKLSNSQSLNTFKKGNYIYIKDLGYDSLMFSLTTGMINHFSGSSGKTIYKVIDFAEQILGLPRKEISKILRDSNYEIPEEQRKEYLSSARTRFSDTAQKFEIDDSKWLYAKDYLVNKRGLNSKIVDVLHKQNLINSDNHGNVIFSWFDQSDMLKPIGMEIKKTHLNGKEDIKSYVAKNSEHDKNGFEFTVVNEQSKTLNVYVFESAIDAISFYQLGKWDRSESNTFLAGSGVNNAIKLAYENIAHPRPGHSETINIIPAFDSDEAGIQAINRLNDLILQREKNTKQVDAEITNGILPDIFEETHEMSTNLKKAIFPENAKDWNEIIQNKQIFQSKDL